jgi:gamma-glutamylcyclotransferase (GGCT)/AIG2-like uncharacterized protein YtfP
MIERNVHFTQRKKAVLNHHRLVFNKIANANQGFGYANVEEEPQFEVLGVLYQIEEAGLEKLDRYEGVNGGHYYRSTVQVVTGDDEPIEAVIYLAHAEKTIPGLKPTSEYLNLLKGGLDILGEEGSVYLDQSVNESRVTNEEKFVDGSDLPTPTISETETEIDQYALPILLNGVPALAYIDEESWSERFIFKCTSDTIDQFRNIGLNVDDSGVFRTKYFSFLRVGIIEFREKRYVIERDLQLI